MPTTNYYSYNLILFCLRLMHIIFSYKNNKSLENDCDIITQHLNAFEDYATPDDVREQTLETYTSFIKINQKTICDKYNENTWTNIEIEENNKFHIALRNIIQDMNRQEKKMIDVLILPFACELGLFPFPKEEIET